MALPADVTTGTWTLDNSHSEIGFTVRHAGISKVRGQFTEAAATLDLPEDVTGARINATINTASFDSGDVNRDGHVKGDDFWDLSAQVADDKAQTMNQFELDPATFTEITSTECGSEGSHFCAAA